MKKSSQVQENNNSPLIGNLIEPTVFELEKELFLGGKTSTFLKKRLVGEQFTSS